MEAQDSFFYAMMLFGCFSLSQSIGVFSLQISADKFMGSMRKLIQSKDVSRAIKLCRAVPKSPLASSVKFVLMHQSSLQQKTPEDVKRFCEDAFQTEARVFSARTAIPLLDAVVYSGAAAIFYVFTRGLPGWQMALLVLPSLAALLMYWLRARILRELTQHQSKLAEMLTVHLPAGDPYR